MSTHSLAVGLVFFVWIGLCAGCTVSEGILDGKPCDEFERCIEGYVCVREPCGVGALCPVCRKPGHISEGIAREDGGPREDGGDLISETPTSEDGGCPDSPPACKLLTDCSTPEDAACEAGTWICPSGFETVETTCDGKDNDCDGLTDEQLLCTLAGNGTADFENGSASLARFKNPRGLAAHPNGGLVVADRGNHAIRLVMPDGTTSTLAGLGTSGAKEGTVLEATFNEPNGVAIDSDGTLFVADTKNNKIRRLGLDNLVSTYAGSGAPGFENGSRLTAKFAGPTSLVILPDHSLLVDDFENHCIRKISADQVTTFAGTCGSPGVANGDRSVAQFNRPAEIAWDLDGNLLVAEGSSHRIRRVYLGSPPSGSSEVVTVAGFGEAGYQDDAVDQARFRTPTGLLALTGGAILVVDSGNYRVRQIAAGQVSSLIGSGALGFKNGPFGAASFRNPTGLAQLKDGRWVIADTGNHVIRVVLP